MPKLDLTKPVQTRGGASARILCSDFNHPTHTVLAAMFIPEDAREWACMFTPEGKLNTFSPPDSPHNLINVPPPKVEKQVTVYLCKYSGAPAGAAFASLADYSSSSVYEVLDQQTITLTEK